ncbi:MAG: PD40 domain-containing protein [Acidothermus cellulolyticus]|nr:PD40 domain-containing protein [Acidothermus cellulolyticus]
MTNSPGRLLRLSRSRWVVVTAALVLFVAIGLIYSLRAVRHPVASPRSPNSATLSGADLFGHGRELVFRSTALGPGYGYVAVEPLRGDTPAGPARRFTNIACDRVYAAVRTLLCLAAKRGVVTTYSAVVYDENLRPVHRIALPGLPSRARLSPDGRIASWTVFVYGDSYLSTGFSTRTAILDTTTGNLIANLETFSIVLNGRPYSSVDVNFWGVTFAADDNTFYATLSTRGQTYLVKGDMARRTVVSLRTNVECPSLSPDGTRLVFKKRVSSDARAPWRLAVLNLATMQETLLAETRSVDDQAAWLDNQTVLYAMPQGGASAGSDLWSVPADGGGKPQKVLTGAFSPAVLAG